MLHTLKYQELFTDKTKAQIKMKSLISTFALSCIFFLTGCVLDKKTSLDMFNLDIYTPEYASGFKIMGIG